jgi:hypothetical protein
MVSSGLRLAFWSGTTVEGLSVSATVTNTYLRWHMYYGSETRRQVLQITKLDDFNRIFMSNHKFNLAITLISHFF